MVDVDGAEFVSIDPFDSVLKTHNTTLDYGLLGQIKLVNLQHACSKECLDVSLPQKQLSSNNHSPTFLSVLSSLLHYRHSLPPSSSIDLCKPSGDALVS